MKERALRVSLAKRSGHSFVGDGWALHTGRRARQTLHAHHAYQVSLGIERAVKLGDDAAPGWIIAPDVPHVIASEGPVVSVYVEPRAAIASTLHVWLDGAKVAPLTATEHAALQKVLALPVRKASARAVLADLLSVLGAADAPVERPDMRVRRLLERLALDPSERVSADELARVARLSKSRSRHVFREQVGLPIRTYRLWLRLQAAVRLIAAGRSVTDAAHEAGFSDAAHLTRTCRRMFGLAPSELPEIDEVAS